MYGSSWCPWAADVVGASRVWGAEEAAAALGRSTPNHKYWKSFLWVKLRVNRPPECNYGSLGCKMSTVTPPLWSREGVPDYLSAAPGANLLCCCTSRVSYQRFFHDRTGITWATITELFSRLSAQSCAFQAGVQLQRNNCCKEQRQPGADGGSSAAVAAGEAELSSFLGCQAGPGTGCCSLNPPVTGSTAELEYSDLDKQEAVFPKTLSPSQPFHNKTEYLKTSVNEASPNKTQLKSSSRSFVYPAGSQREKTNVSVYIS